MDFEKFLRENEEAIFKLAEQNSKYNSNGNALLTKEDIEDDCWDDLYEEYSKEVNHE